MTIRIEFQGETREDILFQIADMLRLSTETLAAVLAAGSADAGAAAPVAAKEKSTAKATAKAAVNGTGDTLEADKPAATAAKSPSMFDDEEEKADEEKAAAPKKKPPTLDELKKALVAHVGKHTEKVTLQLMKKVGKADKISKLDPKYYAAVFDAVTAEL